jgi:hypothetical protein
MGKPRKFSRDTVSPSRIRNPGRPKYETGVLKRANLSVFWVFLTLCKSNNYESAASLAEIMLLSLCRHTNYFSLSYINSRTAGKIFFKLVTDITTFEVNTDFSFFLLLVTCIISKSVDQSREVVGC